MAIGRLYFFKNPSRTLCNKYHRQKTDDTTASSKWMHRSYLKTTAIQIYSNEKYWQPQKNCPWPNVNEIERDFKDNGAVSSLMAWPLPLYCRTTQPADTSPPPPLGWCHHIHSKWTPNFTHIILSIFYILTHSLP